MSEYDELLERLKDTRQELQDRVDDYNDATETSWLDVQDAAEKYEGVLAEAQDYCHDVASEFSDDPRLAAWRDVQLPSAVDVGQHIELNDAPTDAIDVFGQLPRPPDLDEDDDDEL